MRLFDTHAHLDDEQLVGELRNVLSRARHIGVQNTVAIGTTADSSEHCIHLAQEFAGVFAAVGIQPNYCAQADASDWDRILKLTEQDHVIAIGETGLDRYWDHTPFDVQQDYFDRHIRLAQKLDMPFVVHMRDCGDDIINALDAARCRGPLHGVMHSFTGDEALMRACVELGLYISFAGMVTFKKSDDLRAVAAVVPADRLLIETDSPYLSPHPKRSQRPNEPALLIHTAACLGQVRGVSTDEIARLTTENALTLFGLQG